MRSKWNVLDLECAQNGMCLIWNVLQTECAFFWNVLKKCAFWGMETGNSTRCDPKTACIQTYHVTCYINHDLYKAKIFNFTSRQPFFCLQIKMWKCVLKLNKNIRQLCGSWKQYWTLRNLHLEFMRLMSSSGRVWVRKLILT